jgi:polar amino acid transport system substrate-binding protein
MLRKEWAPFANAFNRELQALRENGTLDEILSNYR